MLQWNWINSQSFTDGEKNQIQSIITDGKENKLSFRTECEIIAAG